jgi:hypothetical protein
MMADIDSPVRVRSCVTSANCSGAAVNELVVVYLDNLSPLLFAAFIYYMGTVLRMAGLNC